MYYCKNTGEKVYNYKDYLNTKHWKQIKELVFSTREYKCSCCGTKEKLNIHHMTYERVGCEELKDLVYLCKNCHSDHHLNMDLMKPITGKQIIKKKKNKSNGKNYYKNVPVKKGNKYKKPKKSKFIKLDDLDKYK